MANDKSLAERKLERDRQTPKPILTGEYYISASNFLKLKHKDITNIKIEGDNNAAIYPFKGSLKEWDDIEPIKIKITIERA